MLLERPAELSVCWVESSFLVNYELDTLPLLFAPDSDYVLYWDAMTKLHHRKARQLEQVRRVNTKAREQRERGDVFGCIDSLTEACALRQKIFAASDYQVTAAVEHLIWSQLHLATLSMAESNLSDASTAHRLFSAAAERIRSVRPRGKGVRHHSEGMNVILSKGSVDHFSLVLHHNWSNYWGRRGKWNAAVQHTSKAKAIWQKLVGINRDETTTYLSEFLEARRCAALCGTWEEPNLQQVFTQSRKPSAMLSSFAAAPSDPEWYGHEAIETGMFRLVTINLGGGGAEEDTRPPTPTGAAAAANVAATNNERPDTAGSLPSTNTGGEGADISLTLTLCLDSPFTQYTTTWPIDATSAFLQMYFTAYAGFALRKYPASIKALEQCAALANTMSSSSAECNPSWWPAVESLHALVLAAPGGDKAAGFRMNPQDMMQKDMLGMAKLMREEVSRNPTRRAMTPAGRTMSTGLQQTTSHAAGPTTSALAESSEWSALSSMMGMKLRPKDALKLVGDDASRIKTPLEALRDAKLRTKGHPSHRPMTTTAIMPPIAAGGGRLGSTTGSPGRYQLGSTTPERPKTVADMRSLEETPPLMTFKPVGSRPGSGSSAASGLITATPTPNVKKELGRVPTQLKVSADDELLLDDALKEFSGQPGAVDPLKLERQRQQLLDNHIARLKEAKLESKRRERSLKQLPTEETSMLHEIDVELQEEERRRQVAEEVHRARLEARVQRKKNIAKEKKEQAVKDRKVAAAKRSSIHFSSSTASSPFEFKDADHFEESVLDPMGESHASSSGAIGGGGSGSRRTSSMRFRSGYKLNVKVDTSAEDAEGEHKFDRNYSVSRRRSTVKTDKASGIITAVKKYDLIPSVQGIIEKQKVLRSLLPTMDHRSETYRLVMKELAENETILRTRRSEEARKKLEASAERVAKKAGMVHVWQKVVQKKEEDERKQSLLIHQARKPEDEVDGVPIDWAKEELKAMALTATALSFFTPLSPAPADIPLESPSKQETD